MLSVVEVVPSRRDVVADGHGNRGGHGADIAMRLLALMMVRNAEATLGRVLDGIAEFCDGIVVVEDRSDDNTQQVVREHPLVCQATFISGSNLPSRDWVIDEGILLNRLYRMAERETADWIVRFDVDETVAHGTTLRAVLERQGSDVSAVRFPKVSTWNDPK
ncbi:MAG: glycosyltransferase family 2 protein [Acidimicrobiales bacterium]